MEYISHIDLNSFNCHSNFVQLHFSQGILWIQFPFISYIYSNTKKYHTIVATLLKIVNAILLEINRCYIYFNTDAINHKISENLNCKIKSPKLSNSWKVSKRKQKSKKETSRIAIYKNFTLILILINRWIKNDESRCILENKNRSVNRERNVKEAFKIPLKITIFLCFAISIYAS